MLRTVLSARASGRPISRWKEFLWKKREFPFCQLYLSWGSERCCIISFLIPLLVASARCLSCGVAYPYNQQNFGHAVLPLLYQQDLSCAVDCSGSCSASPTRKTLVVQSPIPCTSKTLVVRWSCLPNQQDSGHEVHLYRAPARLQSCSGSFSLTSKTLVLWFILTLYQQDFSCAVVLSP